MSQQVVAGSNFSLSCGVQLRGLPEEEGGLSVPVVWWSFNNTRISDVCRVVGMNLSLSLSLSLLLSFSPRCCAVCT